MQEKASRAISLGVIGFMIIAVLFAAGGGILLSQVIQSTYSKEPVKPIVVAARDIPAAQPLVKEDFKLTYWPQSSIPRGAFSNIEEPLKGQRVALIPLVTGESILESHLSKPNSGMGIASLLELNERAMSLKTDRAVTLSRLLYPGCLADILVTIKEDNQHNAKKNIRFVPVVKTKLVLQAVKVLAVGWDIDPLTISHRTTRSENDQAKANEDYDTKEARGVVTVALTPDDSERLALASREGEIDFVLRNPKDTAIVESVGASTDNFLAMTSNAQPPLIADDDVPDKTVKNKAPPQHRKKKMVAAPRAAGKEKEPQHVLIIH